WPGRRPRGDQALLPTLLVPGQAGRIPGRDAATAEELVQDSFGAVYTSWRRLRDRNHALSCLRQSVVNRSRSVHRHRAVVNKIPPELAPDMPAAEQQVIIRLDHSALGLGAAGPPYPAARGPGASAAGMALAASRVAPPSSDRVQPRAW